jgi:hypothetical protein
MPVRALGERMLLHEQITRSLAELKGTDAEVPQTVGWLAADGPAVEVDFTVVDSLGCAFRELRVSAPQLQNAPVERLKAWADNLCAKVTYLLEHIGPLEVDAAAQTVLIRSTPPSKMPNLTTFYEVLIKAPGLVSLRRYLRSPGEADREACDIQITHEVLQKLVHDVVCAVPALE